MHHLAGTAVCGGGNGEPAENLEVARKYLQAIDRGATGAELRNFFTSDVVLEEFPNRIAPLGKGAAWLKHWRGRNGAKRLCPAKSIR